MPTNKAVKICHHIVVDKEAGREFNIELFSSLSPPSIPTPQNPPSTVRNAIECAFH